MDTNFYDKTYYSSNDRSSSNKKLKIDPKNLEIDFLLKLFSPKSGSKLLDLGCGTGEYLKHLKGKGIDLWGIDVSKIASEIAKKNTDKPEQIVCASADPMPFEDSTFDVVTAWGVIEHFICTDSILREILRVLKPDGLAIIMVPNVYYYKFIWDAFRKGKAPVRHQEIENLYGFGDWKGKIEKTGFEIIKVASHNKFNKPKIKWLRKAIPFYFSNHFIFFCKK